MSLVFMIFTVQIVLGALDNFWHHEITERLPAKRAAAKELSLHAVREGLYGIILFGLAWYEWRGIWALVFAAMLAAEIFTTLADFIVEDQTRKLPKFERVLHTILAMNYGVALAVLSPVLLVWWQMPSEIAPVTRLTRTRESMRSSISRVRASWAFPGHVGGAALWWRAGCARRGRW